ncbi:MAG TPA: DUF1080 domain-containing protein [Alphaproteobacteria bacterium]|nr:DUF1080 domain-containing protein [Alphaproteobacteria bacterium]
MATTNRTGATVSGLDLLADPEGWRMAGEGRFVPVADGIESEGGPGLFWYARRDFADFVLHVEWRNYAASDNSGVFIRTPALDADWRPAIEQGYEIQIDDRGFDPETKRTGSALHMSGAVYRLAPASAFASYPVGAWNSFHIMAHGPEISVVLNGTQTARLTRDIGRRRSGHIALQCHHPGSRVRFRRLRIELL